MQVPIKQTTGDTLEERLSENAYNNILPARYLKHDSDGNQIEEPEDLFERVAKNIAVADAVYMTQDVKIGPECIKPDHPRRDELIREVFPARVANGDGTIAGGEEVLLTEHNAKWVSYDELREQLRLDGERHVMNELEEARRRYQDLMENLGFIPNSPTLMNAGGDLQQLSACFVMSPDDDISDIHDTARQAAEVFQSGGGVGYAFWKLRPYGDPVGSTGGIASGPISFMRTYDAMCETIAQGGTRRGAQMAVMRISHPDVLWFIHAKNKDVSLAETLRLNDPDDATYTSFTDALAEARGLINDGKVPKHLRNAAEGHLSNFNISVGVTDEFMEAVQDDEDYTFINPRTNEPHIATEYTKEMYEWFGLGDYVEVGEVLSVPAREIWDRVIQGAHENGEPGVVFIDRFNEDHSFPVESTGDGSGGDYEMLATNPCGEQPLMEYESCNLGHINLSTIVDEDRELWDLGGFIGGWAVRNVNYVGDGEYEDLERDMGKFLDEAIDWEELERRVRLSTRFLDNVITMSAFPVEEIEETVRNNRKIGLGIMGLAQMFIQLGLEYGTPEANEAGRQVMKFINQTSKDESYELAKVRDPFKNWKDSKWAHPEQHAEWFRRQTGEEPTDYPNGYAIRNHNTTTIAPTGTTGMVGNTTGGCEPMYNVAYLKNVSEDVQGDEPLVEFDDYFLRVLEANGVDVVEAKREAETLMRDGQFSGVEDLNTVPSELAELFITTGDLTAKEHAGVQCALQEHVDSAISKTVNAPADASIDDTREAFEFVYDNGGKGVTYYRDGSRTKQVLSTGDEGSVTDDIDVYLKDHVGATFDEVKHILREYDQIKAGEAETRRMRRRPKRTVGATYQVSTGYGEMYVTINEDDYGLHEVFVRVGKSGGFTESMAEGIGRMISLALRTGADPQEIIDQLSQIRSPEVQWDNGEPVQSIPDGVAKAMARYLHEEPLATQSVIENDDIGPKPLATESIIQEAETDTKAIVSEGGNPECPDCGSMLLYQEGCKTCPHGCWSQC